jgi:hypothetical protein
MFDGLFSIKAVSRHSTFALLLVVALARLPIVAAADPLQLVPAADPLQTLLHKSEFAQPTIKEYQDAIENNTTANTARREAAERVRQGRAEDASIALAQRESGRLHQTKAALAQQASGFIRDPNTIGGIVKTLTDKDGIKSLFKPLSPEEDNGPWLGGPTVPAGCVEPSGAVGASPRAAECGECFSRAQAELDTVRRRFDRVQRLYRSGIAHMNALISFGESARNVSPFANMATREQARSLAANADQIRASYDRAYDTLLRQLKTALDHVSACEERAFGNDWYNRYGFVLYQSFALHYKRTD